MNISETYCAVLLAGGKSSRMGENKAFLELAGKSFMDIQLDKLFTLGINEIFISGEPDIYMPSIEDRKYPCQINIIPDRIKGKGPLGGLYSCFLAAGHDRALVIGTDTPLVSVATLKQLISCDLESKKDATVLSAASHIEPLIGIYSTKTVSVIRDLIDNDLLALRYLIEQTDTYFTEFDGGPSELFNCNTEKDYQDLLTLYRS